MHALIKKKGPLRKLAGSLTGNNAGGWSRGSDLACFSVGIFASRVQGIHVIKSITVNAVDLFCG